MLQLTKKLLELIVPKSEGSIIGTLLKKISVLSYHLCYEVKDIEEGTERLRQQGYYPTNVKALAPAMIKMG